MSRDRQLHLGAFMRPVGIHTAWWRYPGGYPDANFNFEHLAHFARRLEAAKFDAFFMADHLAVMNMPVAALRRSATMTSFDPLTLLPALAVLTERIGLIATASTTYNEPYHVARKFASLDHISKGRAGWNLVTSGNPDEALNFGRDAHLEHATRYARAREFFDVVTGLWDSFADDAFTMDPASGLFLDPAKMHVLDHRGDFLKVKGPLNVARPVQGWPVIVQAGASEAGKQIAAETAEMVFGAGSTLEAAQAFYADVKGRMPAAGRDPDQLKILPGCFVVLGQTEDEARAKKARLDDLVHPDSGLANLSVRLGVDATGFDLDAPLPELPESNASKSGQAQIVDYARRTGATVRALARKVGGYGGLQMVGTPAQVADRMEEWLETRACDGFNVMFPFVPEGLDDVVDRLVPELQRRGLFRRDYAGTTLRDHLGLARPANRFFPPGAPPPA
ncbi:LLM class flavin-dependent oxidoreductase [Methylobacterium sp. C1]|uniref:LLM class flavin-dependent oxidoreductase n=1 Tax=Methylobacterium sp. C1 TaxID=1479019 RepID=UPI0008DA382C|nr:LLM class flavin-dependent oxidoreductase [Methylobacterium sp. C1]